MAKRKKKNNQISFRYKIVMTFGVIVALIPIVAYAVVISAFDVPSPGFMILGLIGSIGTMFPVFGFATVIANFAERKKMRHKDRNDLKFATVLLFPCLLLVGASLTLSLTPAIYSKVNEDILSFYAFGILAIILMGICYTFSRGAIDRGFRHDGLSLSTIKKLKKGKKNYWWYDALNKEYGMGILYPCNKYFVLSFFIGSAIHLVLGWWLPFTWVSVTLFWVDGLTLSVLMVYTSVVSYKSVSKKQHEIEYGKMRTRARKNSAASGIVALPVFILLVCSIITWFALQI